MSKSTKLKSDLVLKCWILHWKACERSDRHQNWTREALIAFTADKSGVDAEDVKKRISQNFRYSQRQLLEAYVEAEMVKNKTDLLLATAQVVADMRSKLKIDDFDFVVEAKDKSKGVVCVSVDNWKLPDSTVRKGKEGTDWIGDFDDLF
jgi:hypothetical protein